MGYTQKEFSEVLQSVGLGWSQGTLSKIEAGERPVRLSEAASLKATLGLTMDELTGTSEGPPNVLMGYEWAMQVVSQAIAALPRFPEALAGGQVNANS